MPSIIAKAVRFNNAVSIYSPSAATVPLTITGYTGQTANLLELKNIAGTTVFSVDVSGNIVNLGDEYITDALTVSGNATVSGTLDVGGLITAGSGITVSAGGVAITGDSTFANKLTTQNLQVSGDTQFQGNITVATNKRIFAAAGTTAAPGITFSAYTTTGFKVDSSGDINIVRAGSVVMNGVSGGIEIGLVGLGTVAGYSLVLRNKVVDGATAIGLKIGNINTFSTAGAKIASFYSDNVTTEKAAIGLGGEVMAGAGTVLLPSLSFLGDPDTGFYSFADNAMAWTTGGNVSGKLASNIVYVNSVYSMIATTLTLKGQVADGASAVGATIGSSVTLSTAGSKLASVVNNATEKLFITKDGIIGTGTLIANAAGTVAILNDSADVAEANAGWLEIQALNGTRYRMPVWAI